MKEYISKDSAIVKALKYIKDDADAFDCKEEILQLTAADVRENVKAKKVIKSTENIYGYSNWIECSRCKTDVDVDDKYCRECGARFEP